MHKNGIRAYKSTQRQRCGNIHCPFSIIDFLLLWGCVMKFRLSPLAAAMFVISLFTGGTEMLLITYAVMTLHELAHLAAALAIGLRPESIALEPFGVHLRLKNRIVRSAADEVILYAAGPLVNGAAAVLALRMGWERLYAVNIALFVMNLLPVLPLDGGIILKRLLSYRLGAAAARRVLSVTSVLLAAAFAAAAAVGLYMGRLNLSMAVMALFLLGNVLTSREKYDVDFIMAVSGAKKRNNRVRMVIVDDRNSLIKAAKTVSPSCTTIAAVMDGDGRVKELLGEREIIERVPMQ